MKTLAQSILAAVILSGTFLMTSCSDPMDDFEDNVRNPNNNGTQTIPKKPTADPGEGCEWVYDAADRLWEKSCDDTGDGNNGGDDNGDNNGDNNGDDNNNGDSNGNQDGNSGNDDGNSGNDNNGTGETSCDNIIPSGDLPVAVASATTWYSTRGWYIIQVRVCKEKGKVVRYIIEMAGVSRITLHFAPDGKKIS